MNENSDLRNDRVGCLLIHGFGGDITEVQPLAEYLSLHGYKVVCTSLKGHTGKRIDLRYSNYKDWISSAKEGYDRLESECDQIYLVGFSMGGLLAFNIALKNRVNGIVTLNTPIYYWDLKRVAINIADDIRTRKFNNLRRYFEATCKLPVRAMMNFRLLLFKTKPNLREINCPIYIAQALQDDTVHKNSAKYIYHNVGSKNKKIEFYDRSGHHILWSKAAESVKKAVEGFIVETCKSL
jgi:carboxylesterase